MSVDEYVGCDPVTYRPVVRSTVARISGMSPLGDEIAVHGARRLLVMFRGHSLILTWKLFSFHLKHDFKIAHDLWLWLL